MHGSSSERITLTFVTRLIYLISPERWENLPEQVKDIPGVYGNVFTFLGGSLVVFAIGLPWLSYSLGGFGLPNDLQATLVAGFYPFIIGGVIKAAIAAAVLPAIWKAVERRERTKA